MAPDDLIAITVTAPDAAWLRELSVTLAQARLIACANITDRIRSVYGWEGHVQTDTEAVALLHTRAALFDRVAAAITSRHPYEVPQIVALPLVQASAPYAEWIRSWTTAV